MKTLEFQADTTVINCNFVYPSKNYRIILRKFTDSTSYEKGVYNTVFLFQKKIKGKFVNLRIDSLQSHFGEVLFEDFTGDGIKDILIENISDVRSNKTYYLYEINLETNKLRVIEGFNEIKNPRYLKKYDLIDNLVMSGRDWSSFYYIKNSKIVNFEKKGFIVSWQDKTDDEKPLNPETEYNNYLKKVIISRKNNR